VHAHPAVSSAGPINFILPMIAIRNRKNGYGVSIAKACIFAVSHHCSPVRSPLIDLIAEFAERIGLVSKLPSVLSASSDKGKQGPKRFTGT
jgi:5-dehydro-4-deoxyglucarate dehydratase